MGEMSAIQEGDRFELISLSAVGFWRSDLGMEICTICQENLSKPCLKCTDENSKKSQSIIKTPEKLKIQCKLVTGRCRHTFHLHCLNDWMKQRKVCPQDNTPWETVTDSEVVIEES